MAPFSFNAVCTLWFDRIGPWDWTSCCVQHDADYAALLPKLLADAKLEHCVNAVLPGMGVVMWVGVSTLGLLWYAAAAVRYFNARKSTPS